MQNGLVFVGLDSYICKIKLTAGYFYNGFSETLEALLENCHCYL